MNDVVNKICKLDDVVINRIAAGEVVQRPCNAIKELIENSIDAGSDSISVTVDDGGLKLIQIADTGHGIRKQDLDIVCERFTTSKLRKFADLQNISTHGFRGEALASISHVAHVSIMTKTAYEKCAWVAHYKDGKLHPKKPGMSAEPKACAGNKGTTITAEDLFYNMATRKRAFNPRDEFTKVANVVSCYALHNSFIAFNLKKLGENMPKIRTTATTNKVDTISNLFGPAIGKEIIELNCDDKNYGFKSKGYLTNANYNGKVFRFILFINNRLVESSNAKKAFESVYASVLPKHTYPFVFLSIEINPENVDVNVHPTKNEVHFLHEDEIIAGIQAKAEQTLYACSSSRNYYVQARLPETTAPKLENRVVNETKSAKPQYDYQLIRTDCNQSKLDIFLTTDKQREETAKKTDNLISAVEASKSKDSHSKPMIIEETPTSSKKDQEHDLSTFKANVAENKENMEIINIADEPAPKPMRKSHKRPIYLTSVLELQESICEGKHEGATELLKESQYVGVASTRYILVQVKTKLHLFDFVALSRNLLYQKVLFDFQNFDVFDFTEPAPLHTVIRMALDDKASSWNPDHGSKDELASFAVELLVSKREMLEDYFSIKITDDGNLIGLPILIEKYFPMLHNMPIFLLRLATEVNWDDEKECFKSLAKEISDFYSLKLPPGTDEQLSTNEQTQPEEAKNCDPNLTDWQFTLEHVLFPQIKSYLIPDKDMTNDGTILQIADLHDLYKVFERC